jgi:hypothetical protein
MPSIREVVEDVDAALARFDDAATPAEQRRALREVLGHLYALHLYRVEEDKQSRGNAYENAVSQPGSGGPVALGVIYARGRLAHQVTRESGPTLQGGSFGEGFDMRDYDHGTLTWLHVHEMNTHEDGSGFVLLQGKPEQHAANLAHYLRAVAGQPVRAALETARDFLVHPPGMQPLS